MNSKRSTWLIACTSTSGWDSLFQLRYSDSVAWDKEEKRYWNFRPSYRCRSVFRRWKVEASTSLFIINLYVETEILWQWQCAQKHFFCWRRLQQDKILFSTIHRYRLIRDWIYLNAEWAVGILARKPNKMIVPRSCFAVRTVLSYVVNVVLYST